MIHDLRLDFVNNRELMMEGVKVPFSKFIASSQYLYLYSYFEDNKLIAYKNSTGSWNMLFGKTLKDILKEIGVETFYRHGGFYLIDSNKKEIQSKFCKDTDSDLWDFFKTLDETPKVYFRGLMDYLSRLDIPEDLGYQMIREFNLAEFLHAIHQEWLFLLKFPNFMAEVLETKMEFYNIWEEITTDKDGDYSIPILKIKEAAEKKDSVFFADIAKIVYRDFSIENLLKMVKDQNV